MDQKPETNPQQIKVAVLNSLADAEEKAWEALSGYKFIMFGYWAAQWVLLNQVSQERRPNPWRELVKLAKAKVAG